MTALSYYQQLFGAGEFAFAVEGVTDYWTTTLIGWNWGGAPPPDGPDPTDWIQRAGVLKKAFRTSQKVDIGSGELNQGDLTFELLDAEDSDGHIYSVSALMSRRAAAVARNLAADLAAGGATITLDSTAGFVAPGLWFCELETGQFTGIAAGPPRLTGCTRGMYGSVNRAHDYEAPAENITTADYGQIPLVTDRLVSWYGRRCWLWFAEYLENGAMDVAEIVWRGRITSELRATSKVSYSIPAEGLWSAQSVQLLGAQPQSVVKGFYLRGDVQVGFDLVEIFGGALADDSLITIPAGRYATPEMLCATITELLNAELDALALSADRWSLFVDDGLLRSTKIVEDGANPMWCDLYFIDGGGVDTPIIAGFLGMNPGTRIGADRWRLEDGQDGIRLSGGTITLGRAAAAVVYTGTEGRWVPVEDASVFTPFLSQDLAADWRVQSVLTIDGDPFVFDQIDAANYIVHVEPFTDRVTETLRSILVQYIGDAPIQVKQGVWFRGQMPLVWRDAFLDNANVPERMKLGADSRDFDWDDLDAQFNGGAMDRRDRLITGPTAFKDLLTEDFRFSGMIPIIGLDGRITARPMNNSSLVRPDGSALLEVDEDVDAATDRPETVRSIKRVVNRFELHVVREKGRPGGHRDGSDRVVDLTALINEKTSQAAYRAIRGASLDFSGTATVDPVEIASHAYGMAASLFSILAQDADSLRIGPCNGLAYGTLPLDTILLSHWMPPNPTASGERGLVSLPAVILGVEMDYVKGYIWLDVQLVTDGGQRSGFAPAADINTYTDNGAPAGARRYEISLNTGRYCPAAVEEGTFYHVGDKVIIRQWDVDTITVADEPFTLTAVDPDALFLDAAPSAGMQAEITAGRANVTLNRFDTAAQTALAKLFLHVADDADDLLGTSGVLGFKVS